MIAGNDWALENHCFSDYAANAWTNVNRPKEVHGLQQEERTVAELKALIARDEGAQK